jgi:GSH-dependent disulfide-bond oxidoreductase
MIDVYTSTTPEGRSEGSKVAIMLEELGLPYEVHALEYDGSDLPDFLGGNPNHRIPVLVDSEGKSDGPLTVFESGAILTYLAENENSQLLPRDPEARSLALQWLTFQIGGMGPFFGQAGKFLDSASHASSGVRGRTIDEIRRLFEIMELRLEKHLFLAGSEYSLADIAVFPWIVACAEAEGELGGFDSVLPWVKRVSEREAVKKGMAALGGDALVVPTVSDPFSDKRVARVRKVLEELQSTAEMVALENVSQTPRGVEEIAEILEVEPGSVVTPKLYLIGEHPVVVLMSGARECDEEALPKVFFLEGTTRLAGAREVRTATGFSPDSLPPMGFDLDLPVAIEVELKKFETLYVSAGHPRCVLKMTMKELKRLSKGIVSYSLAKKS